MSSKCQALSGTSHILFHLIFQVLSNTGNIARSCWFKNFTSCLLLQNRLPKSSGIKPFYSAHGFCGPGIRTGYRRYSLSLDKLEWVEVGLSWDWLSETPTHSLSMWLGLLVAAVFYRLSTGSHSMSLVLVSIRRTWINLEIRLQFVMGKWQSHPVEEAVGWEISLWHTLGLSCMTGTW